MGHNKSGWAPKKNTNIPSCRTNHKKKQSKRAKLLSNNYRWLQRQPVRHWDHHSFAIKESAKTTK